MFSVHNLVSPLSFNILEQVTADSHDPVSMTQRFHSGKVAIKGSKTIDVEGIEKG